MSIQDEVAEVIYRKLSGKYGDFGHHEDVARALADAGLLAPELPGPGPSIFKGDDKPNWIIEHEHGGAFIITPVRGEVSLPGSTRNIAEARRIALSILAAIEYIENEESNV